MAKETTVTWKCDKCGKPSDDIMTYVIRVDGQAYEVDLDAEHAKPIMNLARLGRSLDTGIRRSDHRAWDRRIRNAPE